MPTKVLREPGHVDALAILLRGRKLPITVSWVQGASLSDAQRRLSFQWYIDISRQLGDMTAPEARAACKVEIGAPILCEVSEQFRQSWGQLRRAMTHEDILLFVERTELPVTSIMLQPQMREYLDRVHMQYSQLGVRLTDPEALKYETEFV